MKCRLCGKTAHEIKGWLERMNAPGVMPAIWECRPACGADISQEDALVGAIHGALVGAIHGEDVEENP